MSSPLSKDLKTKYGVRTMPIHKDDEVQVIQLSLKNAPFECLRMMIFAIIHSLNKFRCFNAPSIQDETVEVLLICGFCC